MFGLFKHFSVVISDSKLFGVKISKVINAFNNARKLAKFFQLFVPANYNYSSSPCGFGRFNPRNRILKNNTLGWAQPNQFTSLYIGVRRRLSWVGAIISKYLVPTEPAGEFQMIEGESEDWRTGRCNDSTCDVKRCAFVQKLLNSVHQTEDRTRSNEPLDYRVLVVSNFNNLTIGQGAITHPEDGLPGGYATDPMDHFIVRDRLRSKLLRYFTPSLLLEGVIINHYAIEIKNESFYSCSHANIIASPLLCHSKRSFQIWKSGKSENKKANRNGRLFKMIPEILAGEMVPSPNFYSYSSINPDPTSWRLATLDNAILDRKSVQ